METISARGCTRRNLCAHVENCQHADKKQPMRRQTVDLETGSAHGPLASWRARPINSGDGLEDMDPWSTEREVARGVLRSSPKPEKRSIFCHRRRIENLCRLFSTQQRPNVYQTPGRRPPPIIGRFVNTVTRGWVGAPNGRAPFRFHGAVVGFCLLYTSPSPRDS